MISSGYVEAANVCASSGSEYRAIGATSESSWSAGILGASGSAAAVVCDSGIGGDCGAGVCARITDEFKANKTTLRAAMEKFIDSYLSSWSLFAEYQVKRWNFRIPGIPADIGP
jgi:hypothetical protein